MTLLQSTEVVSCNPMTTYAEDVEQPEVESDDETDVDAMPKLEHEYAYVEYNPGRPSLTLREAAKACGMSKTSMRRYFDARNDAGELEYFPNRWRPQNAGANPPWFVPIDDLIAAGLNPNGVPRSQPAEALGDEAPADVIDLRDEVHHEARRKLSANPIVRDMQLELENKYLERQLGEKDRVIASKDETIRSKDETIEAQKITIRALALPAIDARTTPTPQPEHDPSKPDPTQRRRHRRFRLPGRSRDDA